MQKVFNVVIAICIFALFLHQWAQALDESIDRQSIMLCQSAKVSGNEDYLLRCAQWYQTGDPRTLRQLQN